MSVCTPTPCPGVIPVFLHPASAWPPQRCSWGYHSACLHTEVSLKHIWPILCIVWTYPFFFLTPGGWGWLLTADNYTKRIFFRFVAIVLSKWGWSLKATVPQWGWTVNQLKASAPQIHDGLPCTDSQALSLCQQAAELLQGVYETAKSLCQPSEVHNILSGTDSPNFMYSPLLLSISFYLPLFLPLHCCLLGGLPTSPERAGVCPAVYGGPASTGVCRTWLWAEGGQKHTAPEE